MTIRNPRRKPILPLALLAALTTACTTPNSTDDDSQASVDRLIRFATALGDAVLQVEGTAALMKKAPHLMPLLDANGNGVLELAEITAFQWDKPADLAAAYIIVRELVKGRR